MAPLGTGPDGEIGAALVRERQFQEGEVPLPFRLLTRGRECTVGLGNGQLFLLLEGTETYF